MGRAPARTKRVAAGFLAALAFVLPACAAPLSDPSRTLEGEVFGTRWLVLVRGPEPADSASLRRAVEAELEAVDRAMSNWREDSELSRLNRSHAPEVPVSEPLAEVLDAAFRMHRESDGAFDITVAPLLRAFGFGPGGDPAAPPPDPGALAELRARVGSGLLELEPNPEGGALLRRSRSGVELDLSAIAKGYAVDRVSRSLSSLGVSEHLVEIGGEIRTRGRFRIGVETPVPGLWPAGAGAAVHRVIGLLDRALATSGGYRDFRAVPEGREGAWTHILDPREGRPVERPAGSVSVIAGSCLEADAWATALFVLGPEAGLELAEARGLAALFLTVNREGAVTETATPAFREAIRAAEDADPSR